MKGPHYTSLPGDMCSHSSDTSELPVGHRACSISGRSVHLPRLSDTFEGGKEENERTIAKVHLTGQRDAKADSIGWRDEQKLTPQAEGMNNSQPHRPEG